MMMNSGGRFPTNGNDGYAGLPRRYLVILFIFLFSACATAPVEESQPPVEAEKSESKPIVTATGKVYVPTESEGKSLELFQQIYDIVESTGDRKSVLPQVEEIYLKIINEYPDAPLAQESYWRLMMIYMEDYLPPDFKKAEALYDDFLIKYPESSFKNLLGELLGKGYYKDSNWEELLKVTSSAYKEYIGKGTKPRPSLLFMYSEANFFTGKLTEAGKGYEALIKLFPRLNESKKAENRLKEIQSKKE